jgi:hypothetical protein
VRGAAPARRWRVPPALLLACVAASVAARPAGAQASGAPAGRPVPFAVGERLEYDVRFGSLRVGRGAMEVQERTELRGRPVWHTVFSITGGIPLYRVNDRFESWFDTVTLASLRFHQEVDEGSYERSRRFEIFPERAVFAQNGGEEQPSVAEPLDDGSFLYFVRTLPLTVGATYELPRYFKPEGNPVRIRVVRRDTVTVPAGQFTALVLQPTFQTRGIFSQNGKAEVWISDDPRRLMVQLKSKLSFGSLNLYLRSVSSPLAGGAPSPRR